MKLLVFMRVSDIGQMFMYFSSSNTTKYIHSQIFRKLFFFFKKKELYLPFFFLYQSWINIVEKNPLHF